jgi:hypothetical protein
VNSLETYALMSTQDGYVIMATIYHNRTERETFEILKALYDDAKFDEECTFIFNSL